MPEETTPVMPWVDEMIDALIKLNTAIPVIFATISGIAALWRSATGSTVSLTELADRIEARVAANDTFGRLEVARLKAALGAS